MPALEKKYTLIDDFSFHIKKLFKKMKNRPKISRWKENNEDERSNQWSSKHTWKIISETKLLEKIKEINF